MHVHQDTLQNLTVGSKSASLLNSCFNNSCSVFFLILIFFIEFWLCYVKFKTTFDYRLSSTASSAVGFDNCESSFQMSQLFNQLNKGCLRQLTTPYPFILLLVPF